MMLNINNRKGDNGMDNKDMDNNIMDEDASMEAQPSCENCRKKATARTDKEYKDLINRLNRIEGQIRGIKGMVENNAYCPDILIQASAANAALNSFSRILLSDHIKTCVTQDIKEGREETVDELIATLQKMMR
jgi:DNA-binding FrmR family transcriptional regulator